MKEKIFEIIEKQRTRFWDSISEVELPKTTPLERSEINEGNYRVANEIIKLFKNK